MFNYTQAVTTSYQQLSALLIAAGVAETAILGEAGFIRNLDTDNNLFVAAGYAEAPATDEGILAPLQTILFGPGLNANLVWVKGGGSINANIAEGFAGVTSPVIDGVIGTIDLTASQVPKGDGAGGLIASSVADNGTTVTLTGTDLSLSNGNIVANGDILSVGGGVGYGVGDAVTQGTSRTQGVTINAPSGAITLFSAAGSATPRSFTVTNSIVAATDTIIVNQKSGTDLYEIFITAVADGSFRITSFTTGGTTTETPVFNFNVIKGSIET
mgnify:CR=1 FL=1